MKELMAPFTHILKSSNYLFQICILISSYEIFIALLVQTYPNF